MYQLIGVLNTRPVDSPHGIQHRCQAPGCHRKTATWVCLEEVAVDPTVPCLRFTGKTMVVGTCCCSKLLGTGFFPIFHEPTVAAALESAPTGISSRKGQKLFEACRG